MLSAYIHIEKTGGQSLNFVLRNSFGLQHCDVLSINKDVDYFDSKELSKLYKLFPNLKSICGHKVKPYSDLKNNIDKDIFYFTFLRDPVQRMISHYQFLVTHFPKFAPPFPEWIQDVDQHNLMTKKIAGSDSVEKAKEILNKEVGFVGIFEEYNLSMQMLDFYMPYDLNMHSVRKNNPKDNAARKSIVNNPKWLEMVIECNKNDAELYHYAKEEIFPKQKEVYESAQPITHHTSESDWLYKKNRLHRNTIYKGYVLLNSILKNGEFKIPKQMVGLI